MLQLVKVQLLGEEIMRLGVDICGLSEVRWDGQGYFTTLDGHTGQVDILTACQEWQSEFIGKSLERLSDMNQSATESLLCDSTQNYETLL